MRIKNFHEYDNVKEVKFDRYKKLFGKDEWYVIVTLDLGEGDFYDVRWSLKDIEFIKE